VVVGVKVGEAPLPPEVIEPVPLICVSDQLSALYVPLALVPVIRYGEVPEQVLIGDVVVTSGVSSQLITRSSVAIAPPQAPLPVTVSLTVFTPVAEVGSNPQVVGSNADPEIMVPEPAPPDRTVQDTVDPVDAEAFVNMTSASPHWLTGVPTSARGPEPR
jgi:hypothetical protein